MPIDVTECFPLQYIYIYILSPDIVRMTDDIKVNHDSKLNKCILSKACYHPSLFVQSYAMLAPLHAVDSH